MKKILVIGSLNMDTVIETPYLPKPGETISGKKLSHIPGGKGANQSYAVGKLGGDIAMIGAVGNDEFGKTLKESLSSVHVDVSAISEMEGVPTGQAFIPVDENGENSIILIAGANGLISKEMIDKNLEKIKACDILMMQLEIPIETVTYAKNLAVSLGKQVIIDPAPALPDLPDELWTGVSYIKPNETEIGILSGNQVNTEEEIQAAAEKMIHKGVKGVLCSLGSEGCRLYMKDSIQEFPAQKVKAVDTTAAGDCFTAGFAVSLSRGESIENAIAFGQKASAIAVTRKGAQTSIPTLEEVLNS